MNFSDATVGTKVRYDGYGRSYLKGLDGKIVNTSANNTSALVEFRDSTNKRAATEWVGVSALNLAKNSNPAIESALEDLRKKLEEKTAEVEQIVSAIAALEKVN